MKVDGEWVSGLSDWSSDDEKEAREKVAFLKKFSVYIKDECDKYALRYFENSSDHWQTVDEVVRFLRG